MGMQLSDNAAGWLSSIIRLRIDDDLRLIRASDSPCDFDLIHPGADGSIRFVGNSQGSAASPVKYQTWQCDLPGIVAPLGKDLVAPLFATDATSGIERTVGGYIVRYDLPWLIYWNLTRLEEAKPETLDQFGRFPGSASFAGQHGFLDRPIVDEWLVVIAQLARNLWPGIASRPSGFRVEPTHDVDFPSKYSYCRPHHFIRTLARDLIRHREVRSLPYGVYNRIASYLSSDIDKRDPFNSFDWIMDQSEQRGLKSIFYFMAGGRHRLDPGYSIDRAAIRRLIRRVGQRGHEIGLHPSFECLDNQPLLERQVADLRRAMQEEGVDQEHIGARCHYYHARYPQTFRQFEAASLSHDATMGFADHTGFRAGTCFAYPAFDHELDRPLALEVRPLAIMEGTLYSKSYMNLGLPEPCYDKAREVTANCRAVGGNLSLLWHNSEFPSAEFKGLYQDILDLTDGAAAHG